MEEAVMGLSGPIKTIACSTQRVRHVCEDCTHADNCALEPGLICTDPGAPYFLHELYVWQTACDHHAPVSGHDLTLHIYP
jgi:hypothetical protein